MHTASQILKKVRRIELKARRNATETFAGGYQSSFRGQGLDFDDFREYQSGDEPRFIDWKVTARMGAPYVRLFREDRELSLLLAVDISASMRYGSVGESKLDFVAELAAVLAFSAEQTGDKCGLILFGTTTPVYIPPAKGYKQVLRIIREIISAPHPQNVAGIEPLTQFLLEGISKKALVIMISDFLFPPDAVSIGKINFKHELITIRVSDPAEIKLPNAGEVILRDAESDQLIQLNLSKKSLREKYNSQMLEHRNSWKHAIIKSGIDHVDLLTQQDYMVALRRLFSKRTRRNII